MLNLFLLVLLLVLAAVSVVRSSSRCVIPVVELVLLSGVVLVLLLIGADNVRY